VPERGPAGGGGGIPSSGGTLTGPLVLPSLQVQGDGNGVGANTTARLLGATTGVPTTGAHVVGDTYIEATGGMWVCTTAGTPGTFTFIGSGAELGYFNDTTAHSGLTATALTAIPGFTKTVPVPATGRPIYVDVSIPFFSVGTTGGVVYFQITEDGVACVPDGTMVTNVAASTTGAPVRWRARRTPSAGNHTYAVSYAVGTAGMSLTITNNFGSETASSISVEMK
jgi:hypothetical protein